MRITVTNNTSKAESILERYFRLAVDGQEIEPDLDGINAAENSTSEKGLGNTLGTSVKAGQSETRILVFKVPVQARQLSLALKTDDKATTDRATPIDLTSQFAQLPALPTAKPVPPTATRVVTATKTATATETPGGPTRIPVPPPTETIVPPPPPAATATVTPTPCPAAPATAVPTPRPAGWCDSSYPEVCIAPPPPNLNCGDIPYRRFKVLRPDPHGFDRDGNGIGCESP